MRGTWLDNTHTLELPQGNLTIHGTTPPGVLAELPLDIQLKAFRPAKRQKQALVEIAGMENGKVVTAELNGEIVGYVTFHPPDTFERWAAGPRQVLELGAIEVAPKVRKYNVARSMLEVAFDDANMENFIVLVTEYYWHWDLDGTGMHVWQYREVMRKLMEHVSMTLKETDDEEINSHAANMLMVRYGKNISNTDISAFESLLFTD